MTHSSAESVELLPCVRCGRGQPDFGCNAYDTWWVICEECGLEKNDLASKPAAIEWWNTRASIQFVEAAEIDRLREAKRRALQLADERAKEAAELRQALNGAARTREPAGWRYRRKGHGEWIVQALPVARFDGDRLEVEPVYADVAQPAGEPIERAWMRGWNEAMKECAGLAERLGDECASNASRHAMAIEIVEAIHALSLSSTTQHSLPGHEETIDALSSLTIRPNGTDK